MTDWPQPLLSWIARRNVSELGIDQLLWIPSQLGSIRAGFTARAYPVFYKGHVPAFLVVDSLASPRAESSKTGRPDRHPGFSG